MKKMHITIATLLTGLISCIYMANDNSIEKYIPPYRLLLTQQNTPTKPLSIILGMLGVEHNGTLDSIVHATQQKWLRAPGTERWQNKEVEIANKTLFDAQVKELGLLDAVKPSESHYSHALILGATLSRTRSRLAYLVELWQQGVSFDSIVILGSQRPLDKEIETAEFLLDLSNKDIACNPGWKLTGTLPKNEIEMMRMVYEQADLPEKFRKIPVIFIDTPNFENPNGTMRRATTGDTIAQWLKTNPIPGPCLLVSSNPYVCYQDSVTRTYLPASFTPVETVGAAARSNVRNIEIFDTLARFLYQENIRRKKE